MSANTASSNQFETAQAFPVTSLTSAQLVAAQTDADSNVSRFDQTAYGVDPVITGPVSPKYRQQRLAAGCDRAEWPNVPAVCYPD